MDTNVLVYAANSRFAEHRRCRDLLDRARAGTLPWYTTWPVLYEFLRVATHPSVFADPWRVSQAWTFVEALLVSPGLRVLVETERHAEIAAQTVRELPALSGNVLHDAHTAVLMREHGIRRIYTRDRDFERFPFLEVLDPLTHLPPG